MAPAVAPPSEGRSAQEDVTIVYDAPAGTIRARAKMRAGKEPAAREMEPAGEEGQAGGAAEAGQAARALNGRVESVSFLNVPSFVLHGGLMVKLASRTIRADVAFGGAFYAIVDSEAAGLPIDAAHLPELRRMGMEIKHAIESAHDDRPPARRRSDRHLRHDLHRPAQ